MLPIQPRNLGTVVHYIPKMRLVSDRRHYYTDTAVDQHLHRRGWSQQQYPRQPRHFPHNSGPSGGDLGSSNSGAYSGSYGSYSGGCGCGGGGGGDSTTLPILLAALAAAVWWLNMQITMARRKRRRRNLDVEFVDDDGGGGEESLLDLVWLGKGN